MTLGASPSPCQHRQPEGPAVPVAQNKPQAPAPRPPMPLVSARGRVPAASALPTRRTRPESSLQMGSIEGPVRGAGRAPLMRIELEEVAELLQRRDSC